MRPFYLLFFTLQFACTSIIEIKAQHERGNADARIAMIGCHNQHAPAPSLPYIAEVLQPDVTVWIGDNVYADTKDNPQYIIDQLEILREKEGFSALKEVSQFVVTWDDHDYGLNNAGKEYSLKEKSKNIHRSFWELEAEIPSNQDGVYYAKQFTFNEKTIQFIQLDGRFNRDKPGRNADALGENQWEFLMQALRQDDVDLRFISCGYQILINRPMRWEAMVRLGKSRKRLMELIESQDVPVLFLTGDQHYVEVLESPRNVDYKTYEIMAAGINKNERPGRAPNRVEGPDVTLHNAPILDVYLDDENPYVEVKNINVETGEISMFYRINLNSIGR